MDASKTVQTEPQDAMLLLFSLRILTQKRRFNNTMLLLFKGASPFPDDKEFKSLSNSSPAAERIKLQISESST